MTRKADFNAEEWSQVLQGPPTAGMLVLSAEGGGTLRESVSMAQAYTEARRQRGSSELLDEIVSANPEFDRETMASLEQLRSQGPQRIRKAVELLEQRATPQEVADYRSFVLDLAERVATAHKEGGFLGIGGKRISDREQAAIDDLAAMLGETSTGQ